MATSNNPEENNDVNFAMANFGEEEMMLNSEETEMVLNNLRQRGNVLQEQPNVYNISAGAIRPGTVDSDTLELMLTQANQTFVPTRTFKDIGRSLEKNCHVTIRGASGEGKTTMALMLGEKYRKQGYELVFVNRADVFDIGSCISSGQKLCLIFDDIFGSVGQSSDITYMQSLCNSLKMHIDHNLLTRQRNKAHARQNDPALGQLGEDDKVGTDKTKHSKQKSLQVIFTAKTYNFKEGMSKMQYQRLSMFNMKTVVDLTTDPDTSYSHEEKKAMFQKHREMHPRIKLGDLVVEDVINQESTLFGFPLTCRLFYEFPTFTEKADDFFKRPLYYLRFELNDILSRKNDQSAALILVLLCEENIKLPELECPNINKKVDEMFDNIKTFADSASRSGTATAARNFRGTFLSRGDKLSFAHSSIYEACACALYEFNPSFVLKYCSLDFLYERLKPGQVDETGMSDRLNYLFVSEEYYNLVVTRLITSMKQGIFSKTVAHPMNQNENFVEKFLEKLRALASEDKDWIQFKEKRRGFLYWIVRSKSQNLVQHIEAALQIKFTQEDIREALFASVESDKLNLLKILIEKLEGDPKQADKNNLLFIGTESGSKEMVKFLLNMGADISGVDHNKRNCLHLLCNNGRSNLLETVKTFSDMNKDLTLAMNAFDVDGRTPIMLAALKGTWDCFRVITNGVSANISDNQGYTLIHLACYGGNKNIFERVLTNENINNRDHSGSTPIMVAASFAMSDIFDLLLSRKAETTFADQYGDTLLHYACAGGNKDIVKCLLTGAGVNINSTGRLGTTPIMVAAADGARSDKFLTNDNINSRDHFGRTPIMVAASFAKSEIFDLLLSRNADTTLVDDDGNTLLHFACDGGNKDIVKRLLTDVNINSRGQRGRTPLMVAASHANYDIVDLLLSHNADTTLVDEIGQGLLFFACIGGNKHIVERLATDVNINSRCEFGITMIMVAADSGNSEIFDFLSSHNADTTLVDNDGITLLHYACWGGNRHIVERVLTSDNVNSRGMFGFVPIMAAAYRGHIPILEMLCEKGADLTAVTSFGMNAVDIADLEDNKDAVKYLKRTILINQCLCN